MSNLYAGYARADATPMRGITVSGYFIRRTNEKVLDPLEVVALALKNGEDTVLLMTLDMTGIPTNIMNDMIDHVSARTGVAKEAVFVHSTHTHTAPCINEVDNFQVQCEEDANLIKEYRQFLTRRMGDAAAAAIEDLKPAKMGYAVGKAENIAFVRRFRMKDGSVKTNPGVNNPDIVAPIGELDERVSVVRFDREGADNIVLANFANHPDVIGGNQISADWPGLFRRTCEKAVDGTKCIFFNGAQGDVNHVNVRPYSGYLNDTFNDFDDVSRGYGHAIWMGRVVAGAAMQVYDKAVYLDNDKIKFTKKTVNIPSNMPKPSDMAEAHRINDLHNAGRDAELPYEGMMLTTVVAEAGRMVRLEHGPEAFPMTFSAVSVGDVAFFGIPGEPFNGIGRALKKAEGWELVLPCCLTNGSEGYFPMQDAYDEGGYEARSSRFKAGVAERIIDEGLNILEDLRK